jgi:hypothetical protein
MPYIYDICLSSEEYLSLPRARLQAQITAATYSTAYITYYDMPFSQPATRSEDGGTPQQQSPVRSLLLRIPEMLLALPPASGIDAERMRASSDKSPDVRLRQQRGHGYTAATATNPVGNSYGVSTAVHIEHQGGPVPLSLSPR